MPCYVFCLGVNHATAPRINPLGEKLQAGAQLLLLPGCKLHLLEQHHACLRWATLKPII